MTTTETLTESKLTRKQVREFRKDFTDEDGRHGIIVAQVRYDDECGNGHNSFAITGEIYGPDRCPGEPKLKHESGAILWLHSCGCVHDDVAEHFPELAPLIKWHMCNSDGPMYYVANTVYLAGDLDYNKRRKCEAASFADFIVFDDVPIRHKLGGRLSAWLKANRDTIKDFEIESIHHKRDPETFKPKFCPFGYTDQWHECPFDNWDEADQWMRALTRCKWVIVSEPTSYSQGKERDLDAARSCAIWPDATDEELTAPDLKDRLLERLPALITEFRAAVESLGFTY